MQPGMMFPPPGEVEEMQAFAYIAGYEFKSVGQGWADGKGNIHGCSWQLRKAGKSSPLIANWDEWCPTMDDLKKVIRQQLDMREATRKRDKPTV